MKFGVYLDCGTQTCVGLPGSQDKVMNLDRSSCNRISKPHPDPNPTRMQEYTDAKTIANWGADYMKYDECYSTAEQELHRFFDMRDALNATGRPILYSICPVQSRCNGDPAKGDYMWDASSVANSNMCRGDHYAASRFCRGGQACQDLGGNLKDIKPKWCSWNCLVDANIAFGSSRYAGPGHWIQSDMLEVGNGMPVNEDEAHFTIWAMLAFPMIAGNDLRSNHTLYTLLALIPSLKSVVFVVNNVITNIQDGTPL